MRPSRYGRLAQDNRPTLEGDLEERLGPPSRTPAACWGNLPSTRTKATSYAKPSRLDGGPITRAAEALDAYGPAGSRTGGCGAVSERRDRKGERLTRSGVDAPRRARHDQAAGNRGGAPSPDVLRPADRGGSRFRTWRIEGAGARIPGGGLDRPLVPGDVDTAVLCGQPTSPTTTNLYDRTGRDTATIARPPRRRL